MMLSPHPIDYSRARLATALPRTAATLCKQWRRFLVAVVLVMGATCAKGQTASVLYDEWFHTAQCRLVAQQQADSTAYWLVLTLDEGDIDVPRGSELVLRLRGGIDVTLTSDADVTRTDVVLRRWRDHTDRIITCRYPIDESQLTLLHEHEVRQLRIATSQGWIERRLPRGMRLQ